MTQLESVEGISVSSFLRIRADAWKVLADAQSALAHTCMVAIQVKSAKLDFLFEGFGSLVQLLQNKCEKEWTSPALLPELEARQLVRSLRNRLRNFILAVQTEIVTDSNSNSLVSLTPVPTEAAAAGGGPVTNSSRSGVPDNDQYWTGVYCPVISLASQASAAAGGATVGAAPVAFQTGAKKAGAAPKVVIRKKK